MRKEKNRLLKQGMQTNENDKCNRWFHVMSEISIINAVNLNRVFMRTACKGVIIFTIKKSKGFLFLIA